MGTNCRDSDCRGGPSIHHQPKESFMRINRQLLAVVALGGFAAAALARAPVSDGAGDGAKSRDQVRAEAIQVLAAGSLHTSEAGPFDWVKLDSTRSRAEVQAEAAAANAAGATSRGDRDPNPSDSFVSSKTRAEVRAEAIEALRLGLVSHGDLQPREATPAELELIRLAGLRARAADDQLAGK
jgi:hypothetical protein